MLAPAVHRTFLALLTIMCCSTPSFADLIQFNTVSPDPRDIIQTKNCLDYYYCAPTFSLLKKKKSSSNQDLYQYTLNVTMDENAAHEAIQRCNLDRFKSKLKITNLTTHQSIPLLETSSKRSTLGNSRPNVYVQPLKFVPKLSIFLELQSLLSKKMNQDAIDFVMNQFKFERFGYSIQPDLSLQGYSVTHHDKKLIRIGVDFFENPCILIQAIRHEFEHVQQLKRASECKKQGLNHNLFVVKNRERAAYLNDYATIENFCSHPFYTKELMDNALDQLFTKYSE